MKQYEEEYMESIEGLDEEMQDSLEKSAYFMTKVLVCYTMKKCGMETSAVKVKDLEDTFYDVLDPDGEDMALITKLLITYLNNETIEKVLNEDLEL